MKVNYKDTFFHSLFYMIGGGISAYYLAINDNIDNTLLFTFITLVIALPLNYIYDNYYRFDTLKIRQWLNTDFKNISIFDVCIMYIIVFVCSVTITLLILFIYDTII